MKAELKQLDEKLAIDRASVADMEKTRNELVTEVAPDDAADRAFAREARRVPQRARVERRPARARRAAQAPARSRGRDQQARRRSSRQPRADHRGRPRAARRKIADELGGRGVGHQRRSSRELEAERDAKVADRARLAAKVQPMTLPALRASPQRKRGSAIAQDDRRHLPRLPHAPAAHAVPEAHAQRGFEQCPSCDRILYYDARRSREHLNLSAACLRAIAKA